MSLTDTILHRVWATGSLFSLLIIKALDCVLVGRGTILQPQVGPHLVGQAKEREIAEGWQEVEPAGREKARVKETRSQLHIQSNPEG